MALVLTRRKGETLEFDTAPHFSICVIEVGAKVIRFEVTRAGHEGEPSIHSLRVGATWWPYFAQYVEIALAGTKGGQARLAITAPDQVGIKRGELADMAQIDRELKLALRRQRLTA